MSELKESSTYDNCIGIKEDLPTPTNIFDALGVDIEETENDDFYAFHWKDMPEFENNEKKPIKSILVHLWTEDDVKLFASTINQKITPKTKFLHFPERPKEENALMRWMED